MRLDEAIVTHLDAAERAALSAALGVEWAALPGEPAAARAAALVERAGRAGQAAVLLEALAAARPGVPWAELPYPRATLHRLHAALCRRHTLDSLRTLCFRLGVDFDDLPGETKAARARELVLAMERMGRVAELLSIDGARPPGSRRKSAGRFGKSPLRRIVLNSPLVSRLSYSAVILLIAGGLVWAGMRQDLTGFGNLSGLRAAARPTSTRDGLHVTRGGIGTVASGGQVAPTTAPTATLTPARDRPAAVAPTAVVVVGERGANLRRGPGPDYAVVATLRAGARLELRTVSPTGEWLQVRLPGRGSPWIDAGYATVIGGTDGVPVATAAATATITHPPAASKAAPARTAGPSPAAAMPTVAVPTTAVPTAAVPTAAVPTTTPPPPAPTLPPP